MFAKTFGWTPSEVDAVDDRLINELMIAIDESAKEEERQLKRGK